MPNRRDDLIKQIRATASLLMVVCFVVGAASFYEGDSRYADAKREIDAILSLRGTVDRGTIVDSLVRSHDPDTGEPDVARNIIELGGLVTWHEPTNVTSAKGLRNYADRYSALLVRSRADGPTVQHAERAEVNAPLAELEGSERLPDEVHEALTVFTGDTRADLAEIRDAWNTLSGPHKVVRYKENSIKAGYIRVRFQALDIEMPAVLAPLSNARGDCPLIYKDAFDRDELKGCLSNGVRKAAPPDHFEIGLAIRSDAKASWPAAGRYALRGVLAAERPGAMSSVGWKDWVFDKQHTLPDVDVEFPVDVQFDSVNLLEALIANSRGEALASIHTLGRFTDAFPALSTTFLGVADLMSIGQLRGLIDRLEQQERRESQSVQIFGGRVPGDLLALAGCILLATFGGYLAVLTLTLLIEVRVSIWKREAYWVALGPVPVVATCVIVVIALIPALVLYRLWMVLLNQNPSLLLKMAFAGVALLYTWSALIFTISTVRIRRALARSQPSTRAVIAAT